MAVADRPLAAELGCAASALPLHADRAARPPAPMAASQVLSSVYLPVFLDIDLVVTFSREYCGSSPEKR
jgi:hypothetical protein